jgi:hypothetical protein
MRWYRKAVTIHTLLVVMLLTGCAPVSARPHTYRAAILMVLDARALRYDDVQVHDGCQPNPSDCSTIGVTVITRPRRVAGWIACQSYHTDCTLWLPALGVHNAPLPALVQDPPWLRILEHSLWP